MNDFGCELDDDGDGIVNRFDQCARSDPARKVDEQGCLLEDVIVLENVHFDTDSSVLKKDAKTVLALVAQTVLRYPELKSEVAGYTDSRGDDEYNRTLSINRATAVREFLITQSVSFQNLSAVGFGEAKPIADNETSDGREMNRRVELHLPE